MRFIVRAAVLGALLLAPAAAMAFEWPWARPSLPESEARLIAMDHGFDRITDIDGTLDGDWHIEGTDAFGHELELTIDGASGEVEHAEMNAG